MNKCLLCNKNRSSERPKYCSARCCKTAWYLRKHPLKKSFRRGDKEFFNTETGIGYRWEEYVAEKLGAVHLKFNNSGCDLDWNGKKVDVKACNLYQRKDRKSSWWVFNRNKIKEVDFFVCVSLIENKLFKTYLIPADKFPAKGITMGHNSKYKEFEIVL